jgi:hypothetical protein
MDPEQLQNLMMTCLEQIGFSQDFVDEENAVLMRIPFLDIQARVTENGAIYIMYRDDEAGIFVLVKVQAMRIKDTVMQVVRAVSALH